MKSTHHTQLAHLSAFFVIFIVAFILMPKISLAQASSGSYTFLEPLPGFKVEENRTDLFARYAKQVFTLILQASAILGVLAITYGGIQYIMAGGSETGITTAKKRIWNGVEGFLIITLSWLILYTINPRIVNFSLCIPSIGTGENYKTCGKGAPVLSGTPAPSAAPGVVPGINREPAVGPSTASGNEAAVRQELEGAGFSIVESRPGATEVGGLQRGVIDSIKVAKQACNCPMTITGGSEEGGGHASGARSHSTGYKIDIDDTPATDSYFASFPRDGWRNGDPQYRGTINGTEVVMVRENDHWDILFNI